VFDGPRCLARYAADCTKLSGELRIQNTSVGPGSQPAGQAIRTLT
jgi:hypothetical protein